MEDISNKTLAILLVFAMIVSLGGTIISLNRLRLVGVPSAPLAGFAVGTGQANLSITQDISISMNESVIDFGEGVIKTGCINANISNININLTQWANISDPTRDDCWVYNASTTVRVAFPAGNLTIRNEGNVNISLTMASAAQGPTNFIGGLNPQYNWSSRDGEDGSCVNGVRNTSWNPVNASDIKICDRLRYEDGTDELKVAFKIVIPSNAYGYKQDNLTFTSAVA